MGFVSWGIARVGLLLVLTLPFSTGDTDPRDVSAINRLYTSLGSPPLLGWIPAGGDPCGEGWQGVSCVFSNITELRLSGLNLGGILDEGIGDFESILIMDLSHNQIGGSIPSNIPLTIRNLFLSGNQFNGSIPVTLSALTQLTQLFLDDNRLSDNIPDSFQELRSLADLDLSGNNLTGQLPPSFGNLSSLTTLHLQNNKISGVLDVLQDLPLSDLNVENNKLSGPIPPKLLNIPNFRKDGNPFNTTILPSPPAALPPFIAWAPSPLHGPPRGRPADGPSSSLVLPQWSKGRVFWTNKRVIVIAAAGIITLIVLGVVLLLVLRCFRGNKDSNKHGANAYNSSGKKLNQVQKSSSRPAYQTEKVDKASVMRPMDGYGLESGDTGISPNLQDEQLLDANTRPASSRHQKNHEINKGGLDVKSLSIRPPLPPPLLPTVEEASVSPIIPTEVNGPGRSSRGRDSCSLDVTAFTIASLQQYTNSFAEENFIGEGMLGGVYRAELPDGKLLAIKKLDTRASRWKTDAELFPIFIMFSIKASSFIYQTEFHTPKFPNLKPPQTVSPLFTPSLKPNNLSFQTTRLHSSYNPISILPIKLPCVSPKTQFFNFFSEKVVVFLVGSFIFLGCFSAKPCLALPAQATTSSRVNLEGKNETQKGKSEEEERYEKILEKEPRNVDALKVLLYGKIRRGKTQEAVECVEKLIDIEPDEVEWRLLQALCYEMMGQLSKAKRLFKEILEETPLLLRALHGLAMVMHKNHEGPAVFEMLNEALEVAVREKRVTEERNIRVLIAQMHVVKGELEEGMKKFQDLINDNPRDFRPYLCQGIIYSLLDKKKEAAEQFEIYQSLVPEEFPQRRFLDDVVLEAKTKSRKWLQKDFKAEFSYKK